MNPSLYSLELTPGARLLLGLLHDDVDDDPVTRATIIAAWEGGQRGAPPPFSWRFAGDRCARLCAALRLGRTQVMDDLAALTRLGVIRRVQRDKRWGWELLGTRPEPSAGSGTPDPRGRQTGPASPVGRTRESATPDPAMAPAEVADPRVRHTGPPGPPHRTPRSATPDHAHARALLTIQQDGVQIAPAPQASGAGRGGLLRITSPAPRDGMTARLAALATEIGGMFIPLDAQGREQGSRRVRGDAVTLERLRRLLAPPADVEIDVWVERRLEEIRAYCRDYAAICKANGLQALHWGPAMLEPEPRASGRRSAWETLTRIVDAWRAEQAQAEQRRRIAEVRTAQEAADARAAAETRTRLVAGELPDDVKAGLARAAGREPQPQQVGLRGVLSQVATRPSSPGRQPAGERPELSEADEEQLRWRGRQRETDAERADELEQHIRQRINAAFADYRRVHGKSPDQAVAEEIRRLIRAEEETRTGT